MCASRVMLTDFVLFIVEEEENEEVKMSGYASDIINCFPIMQIEEKAQKDACKIQVKTSPTHPPMIPLTIELLYTVRKPCYQLVEQKLNNSAKR